MYIFISVPMHSWLEPDIKGEPQEDIRRSVQQLFNLDNRDIIESKDQKEFYRWVASCRDMNPRKRLYNHYIGFESENRYYHHPSKIIYLDPILDRIFELPVIDNHLSQEELTDLTCEFLSITPTPSIVEKKKTSTNKNPLSTIEASSSDEGYEENLRQLIVAQLNLKIKKTITDPRWNTMGVGFFGSKTPTTIAQLRTLFSNVEKSEIELMDEAERILENSLNRTPTFRSTEVEHLYRTLLQDISDFRENYSFAKPAENITASGGGFFSFFTSFYETNIRPYFGSDNHPPEMTL